MQAAAGGQRNAAALMVRESDFLVLGCWTGLGAENRGFFKKREVEDLQNFVEAAVDARRACCGKPSSAAPRDTVSSPETLPRQAPAWSTVQVVYKHRLPQTVGKLQFSETRPSVSRTVVISDFRFSSAFLHDLCGKSSSSGYIRRCRANNLNCGVSAIFGFGLTPPATT
jgi:hypothetical protein